MTETIPVRGSRPNIDSKDEMSRDAYLSEVISPRLENAKHYAGRRDSSKEVAFFCRSELEEIWDTEAVKTVFYRLSDTQQRVIKDQLLLFISFLALVGIGSSWFSSCEDRLFSQHDRAKLRFTDDDGPRSKEELLDTLAFPIARALQWREQYMFRPATVTLDPDGWEIQKVDWHRPLPFENPNTTHPTLPAHGDSPSTNDLGSGTVRLYQIPQEYASFGKAGTEWKPVRRKIPIAENACACHAEALQQSPPLVVVKSFSASQRVVDEVNNMVFLKQSLTRSPSIAIHDAIIEQKSEAGACYSIILPYATLGDLSLFLRDGDFVYNNEKHPVYNIKEKFPRMAEDPQGLASALLEQCNQLAKALRFLHKGFTTKDNEFKVFCAHLDLKPPNILIFDEPGGMVGKWKICDFGISVLQAKPTQPFQHQDTKISAVGDLRLKAMGKTIVTISKQQPSTYQPPEIECPVAIPTDRGGRSIDIWSYGTIFAEVLAYAFRGSRGVDELRQRRFLRTRGGSQDYYENDLFYTLRPRYPPNPSVPVPCSLRHEVHEWLNEFNSYAASSTSDHPCFKCWAECVRHILEVDPYKRPEARTLAKYWLPKLIEHSTAHGQAHLHFSNPAPRRASDVSAMSVPVHEDFYEEPVRISTSYALGEPMTAAVTSDSSGTNQDTKDLSSISSNQPYSTSILSLSGSTNVLTLSFSAPPVAHDVEGNKLIYLTGQNIEVVDLTVSRNSPSEQQARVKIPLHVENCKWMGIRVATPYAAIWGLVKNTPVLRVYNVSTESPSSLTGRLLLDLVDVSIYFDYAKRLAVSREGYVALFKGNVISIFDTRNSDPLPKVSIPLPKTGLITKFVDIDFDDAGSRLYAWANKDINGLLIVYEISKDPHRAVQLCQRQFKNHFSGQRVRVIALPSQNQHECIISAGRKLFLGCVDEDRRKHLLGKHSPGPGWTPQPATEPPEGSDIVAACALYGSIVTLQGGRRHLRRKAQIFQHEIRPRDSIDFRLQRALADLKEPPDAHDVNTIVKMSVMSCNDADGQSAVVVSHRKGKVEVIT